MHDKKPFLKCALFASHQTIIFFLRFISLPVTNEKWNLHPGVINVFTYKAEDVFDLMKSLKDQEISVWIFRHVIKHETQAKRLSSLFWAADIGLYVFADFLFAGFSIKFNLRVMTCTPAFS